MSSYSLLDRFFTYVKVHTTADPSSSSYPSSERQKDLGRLLYKELRSLGLEEVEMDDHGIIYATIPATVSYEVPTLCFCSHMDTSPDSPGENVTPLLHKRYDGQPIVLPDDPNQVIDVEHHPYLKEKIGEDIITASGTTLLGADDKSGIAIIMAMTEYLLQHKVPHGKIRILFTCDEEIGRGVDFVDMNKLNADFGYTLDGSKLGTFEDENFNADAVVVSISGVAEHPGYAYKKLVSALKVASSFVDHLPIDSLSPEQTKGDEGFVHPVRMSGTVEKAEIQFIIRDFSIAGLDDKMSVLQSIATEVRQTYPEAKITLDRQEQYRNMKYKIDAYPQVRDYALQAMKVADIVPKVEKIRGGTDGARLSEMGLPCPNIFTGQQAIHSRQEWISLQDMERATQTLVELVQIWANSTEVSQ